MARINNNKTEQDSGKWCTLPFVTLADAPAEN